MRTANITGCAMDAGIILTEGNLDFQGRQKDDTGKKKERFENGGALGLAYSPYPTEREKDIERGHQSTICT